MCLLDGEGRVVDDAAHADIHAAACLVDQTLMRFEHGERLGQAGAVRIAFDEAEFRVHAPGDAHAHLPDGVADELPLFAHVRNHFLRGIGWRGGAKVGRQIGKRPIVLVPDGGNQRRAACGCRAYHAFIRESDEVFEGAAAACHDDHVHFGIVVQLPDRRDDVGRALRALHVCVQYLETHGGPTQVHVGDHIAFRACLRGADQADALGEFGQRHFAVRVEEAFAFEFFAQFVDLFLETAGADFADVVTDEAQSCLFDPDVGMPVDDHAVALTELGCGGCECSPTGDRDGDVFEVVAHGEVGGSGATRVDFGDLPANPGGWPFFHGCVEFLAEHADRPGVVRGGFARQSRQLFEWARYRHAGRVQVFAHGHHYRCGVESAGAMRRGSQHRLTWRVMTWRVMTWWWRRGVGGGMATSQTTSQGHDAVATWPSDAAESMRTGVSMVVKGNQLGANRPCGSEPGAYRVSRSDALRLGLSKGFRRRAVTCITQFSFRRYYAKKHYP